MTHHRLIAIALTGAVVALAGFTNQERAAATAAPAVQAQHVAEIEIKATKYEWTPNKIEVPANTAVRFKVTAVDTEHGFEIEGVKDSCVKIPKGTTATIDYKAGKAGVVNIKCCKVCGLGHSRMKGSFTIK